MDSISFFGTRISITNPQHQVEEIHALLKTGSPAYITYSNVHVVVSAKKDERLRDAVNHAAIASPDGMPLVWVAKAKGHRAMAKCSGPDMMGTLMAEGLQQGFTHYFYGSTDQTLTLLRAALEKKYPGIRIAGMVAPPFRPLTAEEDDAQMAEINRLRPDFIWVGLGAPKQELWMRRHVGELDHGILFGVGAAFDFLAGNKKRAPEWMQKNGLEWLHRLLSEPRRLFGRYLQTNSLFIWYLLVDLFSKDTPSTGK